MSKPAIAVQKEIEKIYGKKKRLAATEENLSGLKSIQTLFAHHPLSPNTGMEMQKAKSALVDDYAKTIAKLKVEINALEQIILTRMGQEGWQDGVLQEIAIAHPDNRNQTLTIKVGLKDSQLILEA